MYPQIIAESSLPVWLALSLVNPECMVNRLAGWTVVG